MTKEESIAEIEWVRKNGFRADKSILGTERILTAFNMAIEALKEEQITHCKDCVWYHAEHILLNDGTERTYTDDDVDGLGIPHSVTIDVGINCGGMCEYRNREYCFMEEDDYCSRAEKRDDC